jgi:CheY-like chemotaxis protein
MFIRHKVSICKGVFALQLANDRTLGVITACGRSLVLPDHEPVQMKLLIIGDSYEMRRLIRRAVVGPDDVVYELCDGSGALASYSENRPDWVLMDIKMPNVDGISATRQIKTAFPEARIIVVSQYNDPEIREAARQAGAAEYVLKDNLLAIRRILGREGGPARRSRGAGANE